MLVVTLDRVVGIIDAGDKKWENVSLALGRN